MSKSQKIVPDQIAKTCYHCGEVCAEEIIPFDEKNFCCTGCKLVYEVLLESDLCNYYAIETNPGGTRRDVSTRSNRFDYLWDTEIVRKLLDFQNETYSHVTFKIPLIHCASCIWLLENLHQLHEGVISGRVDFLRKSVRIKFDHRRINLRDLVLLLSKIGYEPTINLADVDEKQANPVDRRLIYKLAVAGFCFGNMMFFSLPEYFSEAELLGEGFKGLFNYLNVLLALPVFFYSATDYYRSAWIALKSRTVNMDVPIAIGIITLFFFSLYEIFVVGQEGYMDTLGGLLFFLLIGKLYQQKTYDTLSFDRNYKSYFPVAVTRINKGSEEVIALTKLQVGDIILVRNEELIPSDSILLEGEAAIDYSFVTGEEVPVVKKRGELVYAGGRQKGNPITLTVQKSPSQGYLTDLWNNEAFQKKEDTSLETLATRISGRFTFTVLMIAFGALVYWSNSDLALGVRAFTAVLIITCPCALAMSTPFTLGNTLRIFGQGKFFLKNAQVIERMAQIDTVVFDKTGTLTDPSEASITYHGEPLTLQTKGIIKSLVNQSTHPLSNRINSWLEGVSLEPLVNAREIKGKGLIGYFKGQEIRLGSMAFTGGNVTETLGGNYVFLAVEGEILGYFRIQSGLRPGISTVVANMGKGRKVHFLSGDHGHERDHLRRIFGKDVIMNFSQSPVEKLEYIKKLSKEGNQSLMIGDGLNDAGALRESQVGIALTTRASNFSPASDAIMDASALTNLPAYMEFAKMSRKIIKASFGLSFTYNAVGVFFAVQGLVSPVFCAILMPLSSISVVVFTTLTTNYLAYSKGLKTKIF
jgi:P-type Cu+ transporter